MCDFVAALQVCKGLLNLLYMDSGTSFGKDEFWAFNGLLDCLDESIHLKWVVDLNLLEEAQLISVCKRKQFWTICEWQPINQASFVNLISWMKSQCNCIFLQTSYVLELSVKCWYPVCFPLWSPPHPLLYCVLNLLQPLYSQF
jgi:hypothetical protein